MVDRSEYDWIMLNLMGLLLSQWYYNGFMRILWRLWRFLLRKVKNGRKQDSTSK